MSDAPTSLLEAAKKLFADKGFDGVSVKDICDKAGVNVSLVSYHFGSKEGLFNACLEKFGQERLKFAEMLLKDEPKSREDFRQRIKMFTENFVAAHLEEPEVSSILQRECGNTQSLASDLFKSVFLKSFEYLVKFTAKAQKNKYFRSDLDPLICAGMYFGSFVHLLRVAPMLKEFYGHSLTDKKFQSKVIEQALSIFLEGGEVK